MTEQLSRFLDVDVHVDAGDLCIDGRLVLRDGNVCVVGVLGQTLLELPLDELRWIDVEPRPHRLPAWPDVSLEFGRPWLLHAWDRAQTRSEHPCLDFIVQPQP